MQVAYIPSENVLPRTRVSRSPTAPQRFNRIYTEPFAERRLLMNRMNNFIKERRNKMARVKTMAGIESISGRAGDYCFRTMRASGKVFMYAATRKKSSKTPTATVIARRERFGAITKMVAQLRKSGSKKTSKQLWKIAQEAYDAANQ